MTYPYRSYNHDRFRIYLRVIEAAPSYPQDKDQGKCHRCKQYQVCYQDLSPKSIYTTNTITLYESLLIIIIAIRIVLAYLNHHCDHSQNYLRQDKHGYQYATYSANYPKIFPFLDIRGLFLLYRCDEGHTIQKSKDDMLTSWTSSNNLYMDILDLQFIRALQ